MHNPIVKLRWTVAAVLLDPEPRAAPTPMQKTILFVCVQNSARSQMAEALMNDLCGEQFRAMSAGMHPGKINPLAVEVMAEIGLDISGNRTKDALELFRREHAFDYIIAVCDLDELRECPTFPGRAERLHWPMSDVASLTGTGEQRLAQAREVRERIRTKVEAWREVFCATPAAV